jgi:Integrase core domain/GAG-pre-integrase domain
VVNSLSEGSFCFTSLIVSTPHPTFLFQYLKSPIAIDSGCSTSLITDEALMVSVTPHVSTIGTANASAPPLKSTGVGAATIPIGNYLVTIQQALFCPDAPCNLIATNDLEKASLYFLSIDGKPGKIRMATKHSPISTDTLLVTCVKRFGLHFIPASITNSITSDLALLGNRYNQRFQTPSMQPHQPIDKGTLMKRAILYHNRLGHVSYARLRHMVNHSTTLDLPLLRLPSSIPHCEICIKSTRKTAKFKKVSPPRNLPPGGMLHMDVVEIKPLFLKKFRYLLIAVDDTSRYTWAVQLETKDMALVAAIKLIENIKVVHDRRVEVLRFDRGELKSNAFDLYTTHNNIRCEMSPRKTPQLDGTAERHIQTVVHILRSLLLQSNMPSSCWGHAVTFALQVKNSLPILSRSIASPYESFFGIPPKLAHLRTFGCKVLFHLHKDDYSKLDARAEQAIYLAHKSASIVELLDKTGRIIERRFDDCVFFEDDFPPVPYTASIIEPLYIISTPMVTATTDSHVAKFLTTRAQITAQPLTSILPKSLAMRQNVQKPLAASQSVCKPLPPSQSIHNNKGSQPLSIPKVLL